MEDDTFIMRGGKDTELLPFLLSFFHVTASTTRVCQEIPHESGSHPERKQNKIQHPTPNTQHPPLFSFWRVQEIVSTPVDKYSTIGKYPIPKASDSWTATHFPNPAWPQARTTAPPLSQIAIPLVLFKPPTPPRRRGPPVRTRRRAPPAPRWGSTTAQGSWIAHR